MDHKHPGIARQPWRRFPGIFLLMLAGPVWATCTNPLPPPPVPVLHSNPGALRFVYLDFDGYCEPNFATRGLPAETWPPFDTSADPDAIHDIFERVAEDLAPFDVNVTTEWPSNMAEHFFWQNDAGGPMSGIRVVITGADLLSVQGKAPGDPLLYNIAYVDQFNGSVRRTSRQLAQTISHEIGHTFSFYLHDVTGAPVSLSHYTLPQHNLSAQNKTPILGASLNHRDIWWKDSMVGVLQNGAVVYRPQEDMMVLWAATGFRDDDHRDEAPLGTPLLAAGGYEARGIVTMNAASFPSSCAIWGDPAHPMCHYWRQAHGPLPELLEDEDFFRFRTANTGVFEVKALTINNPGSDRTRANLHAEIELWRRSPDGTWSQLPDSAFTRLSLSDPLSVGISVSEGSNSGAEYALAVKSAGQYGDLGQYTVEASGPIIREAVQDVRLDDPRVPGYDEAKLAFAEPDAAWFRVRAEASGTLLITAEGFDGTDGGHAVLELFDARLKQIGATKPGKPLLVPAPERSVHLLRVRGSKTSGRIVFQRTSDEWRLDGASRHAIHNI